MQAVILAAGKGTRMRSKRPKVLQEVFGRPILAYVFDTLRTLRVSSPVIVIGSGADQVRSFIKSYAKEHTRFSPKIVLQREQKGTGHAVMMARRTLAKKKKDILIWPGDMPLLTSETIREFMKSHSESRAEVSVLSSFHRDPTGYGRILRAGNRFYAIREELDATQEQRQIQEVNTGIYLVNSDALFEALDKVRPSNSKKEFYLTDTIEILSGEGARLEAFGFAQEEEAFGVNSRAHLAEVKKVIRDREIQKHLENGVTIVAPDQTFIEPNVKIGRESLVYPWCYIESGVTIGKTCQIGPFAKIRSQTRIGDEAVIGSFVEVTRSKVGKKVIAKHLTYLGDSIVSDHTNIGAGTVTANFDGRSKNITKIGKRVLVGSNTVFVAPVSVGDGARTGAGSVLTAGSRVKKKQVVAGVPAKLLKKSKR